MSIQTKLTNSGISLPGIPLLGNYAPPNTVVLMRLSIQASHPSTTRITVKRLLAAEPSHLLHKGSHTQSRLIIENVDYTQRSKIKLATLLREKLLPIYCASNFKHTYTHMYTHVHTTEYTVLKSIFFPLYTTFWAFSHAQGYHLVADTEDSQKTSGFLVCKVMRNTS